MFVTFGLHSHCLTIICAKISSMNTFCVMGQLNELNLIIICAKSPCVGYFMRQFSGLALPSCALPTFLLKNDSF